ncbi:MAG: Bax inhibitor-1/YccA family protein [Holosporales bacterium]|jgi:FtsH-binding integral membrane protein|nr:Bax inhibitor-1/YccA family protein [Holosporales bacterium]
MNKIFSGSIEKESGLRKYMIAIFNKMFLALGLTGIISYLCSSSEQVLAIMSGGFSIVLMLATFGIVIYLSARINKIDSEKANALFWIYSALLGAFLAPVFVMYTGESVANAFFTTAIFFGSLSLYGYTTKRDLTSVGSFMTIGLFAVILTSFVNIFFLKNSIIQVGLSVLCVVIFCGLTAYDVQKIKNFYNDAHDEEGIKKIAVIGALNLYLDFINLFLAILRLFGNRK